MWSVVGVIGAACFGWLGRRGGIAGVVVDYCWSGAQRPIDPPLLLPSLPIIIRIITHTTLLILRLPPLLLALLLPSRHLPPHILPNRPEHKPQCRKNQDRRPQRHSPRWSLDVAEHNPELHHDSEDGDVGADLQDGPEAPIQLHQVFAVAELDVEECEAFEDCCCCREDETERGYGEHLYAEAPVFEFVARGVDDAWWKRFVALGESDGFVMLKGTDAHHYQNEDEEKPEDSVCFRQGEMLKESRIVYASLWVFVRELARHDG